MGDHVRVFKVWVPPVRVTLAAVAMLATYGWTSSLALETGAGLLVAMLLWLSSRTRAFTRPPKRWGSIPVGVWIVVYLVGAVVGSAVLVIAGALQGFPEDAERVAGLGIGLLAVLEATSQLGVMLLERRGPRTQGETAG